MSRDRAGMTIPLVAVLIATVMVVALAGRSQASAQRRALEKVLARRLAEMAAASAFEEAAVAFERANATVPPPPVSVQNGAMARDLGPALAVPATVEAKLSQEAVRAEGVAIGPVQLKTSAWVLLARHEAGTKRLEVRETGVLELATAVTVHGARYAVTCRRTMDATPAPGNAALRVHVHPQNRAVVIAAVP